MSTSGVRLVCLYCFPLAGHSDRTFWRCQWVIGDRICGSACGPLTPLLVPCCRAQAGLLFMVLPNVSANQDHGAHGYSASRDT